MTTVKEIMERLVIARKQAGLSQTQAAKLLGYANASSLSAIETDYRSTEPNLSMFLKMCELYQVSTVWALTGQKPDFDEESFDKLTQFSNAAIEDIAKLKELLTSMTWENAE